MLKLEWMIAGLLVCLLACTDDPVQSAECSDFCTAEGSSCDGDAAVTCSDQGAGCFQESRTQCDSASSVCVEQGASARCLPPAGDCEGRAVGDSFCTDQDQAVVCEGYGSEIYPVSRPCDQVCELRSGAASCVASCIDHPGCAGRSAGEVFCDGRFLNQCSDSNGNGCVDLQQESCGPGRCSDVGAPACVPAATSGQDCGTAVALSLPGFEWSASSADPITDDLSLAHPSCASDADRNEVVVSVELSAGQTLVVNAAAKTLVNAQSLCGGANECLALSVDPENDRVRRYTASAEQTLSVVVEPEASDDFWRFELAVDPLCGDGMLEAGEWCDDGGAAGAGCPSTCVMPDFKVRCDGNSPSLCQPIAFLGEFVGGDVIPSLSGRGPVRLTLAESVVLSGAVVSDGFAYVYDGISTFEFFSGSEPWPATPIPAGTYVIDFFGELELQID